MNNTALRAEKEITNTIIFRNEKHKDFYQTYMKKMPPPRCVSQSLDLLSWD